MVRNCVAHDGTRAPIQLVDEKGCVSRPKIMSPFKKIKNFDATANVLAYAYFQAFKFPLQPNLTVMEPHKAQLWTPMEHPVAIHYKDWISIPDFLVETTKESSKLRVQIPNLLSSSLMVQKCLN